MKIGSNLNTREMLEKFETHIKSDEGKAYITKFKEKRVREESFKKRWAEKVKNFILSKTDDELDLLFNAFQAHDRNVVDRLWDKNIDGESALKPFILAAFSEIGKQCKPKKWGMFTTAMYKYKDIYCEQISGQGTFIKLYV